MSAASSSNIRTLFEVNAEDEQGSMGVPDAAAVMSGQYRDWFFTINNPSVELRSDGVWERLTAVFGAIRGGVCQHERAATDHIQGCFRTLQKYRMITMKNKMRGKALGGWIKPSIDFRASAKYCSKEETRVAGPWWYGEWSNGDVESIAGQGKRTDLAEVAVAVGEGKTMKQIALQFPTSFMKYHHGIKDFVSITRHVEARSSMTQLVIYWGAAGTGKSRRAMFEAEARGAVYRLPKAKDSNVIWWPGYEQQPTVIMDDYYGWYPIDEFLKLIDRYEYKVRTKQDEFVQFNSSMVIVTSNSPHTVWYSSELMQKGNWKEALERRISVNVEFKAGSLWEPVSSMLRDDEDVTGTLTRTPTQPLADLIAEQEADDDLPDRCASPIAIETYMHSRHVAKCKTLCDCREFRDWYFVNEA